MPEISKYNLTVTLEDFSQRQYEVYQPLVLKASRENYFDFGVQNGGGLTAVAVVRGATIRAAIAAGFLKGIAMESAGDLTPVQARWLAEEIEKHVREVTTPPPDPN